MPNIRAAIKSVRTNKRRTAHRKNRNSQLKTYIKKTHEAIEASAENADASFKETQKKLDQAVAKGLIHKNKAARIKGQLAKKLNA